MKITKFTTQKSVTHDFQACSSEIAKLFAFYAILGLHNAFKNVCPCISEKGL